MIREPGLAIGLMRTGQFLLMVYRHAAIASLQSRGSGLHHRQSLRRYRGARRWLAEKVGSKIQTLLRGESLSRTGKEILELGEVEEVHNRESPEY